MRLKSSARTFQKIRPRSRVSAPYKNEKVGGGTEPSARDLLSNVNGASAAARNAWLAFLGITVYLMVTLAGVTHENLLLNTPTTLPFVDVKVPLDSFFVVAPLVYVLVHTGFLVQHEMLVRKLEDFEAALKRESPVGHRNLPIRGEVHSYFFSQAKSGKPRPPSMDTVLHLMVALTFVLLPAYVLLSFQIGFLAYHSWPLTWWHRFCLVADLAFLAFVSRYIWEIARDFRCKVVRRLDVMEWYGRRAVRRWLPKKEPPHRWKRKLQRVLTGALHFGVSRLQRVRPIKGYLWFVLFISVFVATLPDSWLDRTTTSLIGIRVPFEADTWLPRVKVTCCGALGSGSRWAFLPTALLFERQVEEKTGRVIGWPSWSRNLIVTDKDLVDDSKKHGRISLRGRDLRYGTFDRSDLKRADFFGAELQSASFVGSNLNRAIFRTAKLHGADLESAGLQGAVLLGAGLQGADLRWARIWQTVPPDEKTVKLARLSLLWIVDLSEEEVSELSKMQKALHKLSQDMSHAKVPGHGRVAAAYERVKTRLKGLLDKKKRPALGTSKDLEKWVKLRDVRPSPKNDALAAYLGQLACSDDTDKGYMAQRLVDRVLNASPSMFLKSFQGCPAMKTIPEAMKARLVRAARLDTCEREQKKMKSGAAAKTDVKPAAKPEAKPPTPEPDPCAAWR